MEGQKMKYSWNTARGAKIELDIDKKVITEETLWNDGNEVTVPCHKWQYTINSLLVNGQEMKAGAYKQQIGRWPENVHHAFVVFVVAHGKKQKAFIEIPDAIENEIYGEERAYQKAKVKKELAVAEEYESHYNAVMDMLNK
nr:MAG TPA: hypothetical protein [Caudoviricetes sp.]